MRIRLSLVLGVALLSLGSMCPESSICQRLNGAADADWAIVELACYTEGLYDQDTCSSALHRYFDDQGIAIANGCAEQEPMMSEIPSGVYDALFGTATGPKYGRIDRNDFSSQPAIHWDADAPSDDTKLIVTQPDDRFAMTFERANVLVCFLGAPDPVIVGEPPRCFETRPSGARGPSESPMIVTLPSGMIQATVEYIQGDWHWSSAALTLVKRP